MTTASATPLIRATTHAELLGIVPALAGFHPHESVVLPLFRGVRATRAMRFDLPRAQERGLLGRFAAQAVGMARRVPDVDGIAVIVYTGRGLCGSPPPHEVTVHALARAARGHGLAVIALLGVGADGWLSYLDGSGSVRSLAEITASSTRGRVRELGLEAAGDQRTVPPYPRVAGEVAAAFARALAEAPVPPEGGARAEPRALLALVEAALGSGAARGRDPEPEELPVLAELVLSLRMPRLRDATELAWEFGGPTAAEAMAAACAAGAAAAAAAPSHLVRLMAGQGPRPDPARVRSAQALLRWLVAAAPPALHTEPLCLLARLHWALGELSRAGAYLQELLRRDPQHGMGRLLSSVIDRGMVPAWAFGS